MSSSKHSKELRRLALSVLQPGFVGTEAPEWVLRAIRDGLSSVVLFTRNIASPEQLARLTAQLRAENPALIIAIDEEAGDVTRIESATGSTRPGNFALGAVDDPELTESVARDLGRQLHAAGVSLDYAPSVDVNSNPDNPIIGVRSFGIDSAVVSRHTTAWVRGLQSAGVAACAKHFPGHGDVAVDSHHGLPSYDAGLDQIAAQALPPFRAALDAGVRAVMSGHLLVPAYDPDRPATLSHRILNGLLREELGFDGLIVTDAIEMGAVTHRYGIDGATVKAIAAGADAICVGGENAEEATAELLAGALVDAVSRGELAEARLAEAADRVRAFADWSIDLGRAVPVNPISGDIGFTAARRAVRLSGSVHDTLPLAAPPHVVELVPTTNLAIGKETPWGVAAPLRERLPGTTFVRVHHQELTARSAVLEDYALAPAAGRPMVIVVRDASRHAWMGRALADLAKARPDAIVVEMGLPGGPALGAVQIFTHGATAAAGVAAAEVLAGAR
ncbi:MULTISPECIES: glycoside hydrolase family 3 protein [Streptomyces]|uniref:Glycoside hydrolase family 3 protein n=1 Tax=Streptomyces celluloflavus TaxID=58344 RepID=A0ABW7RBB1_9ACTN|nr:glycoside hydrolase family 3 N-terminal domain-containing protein [Streptomyces sp. SID7805]MYU55578.1 glycoside hydrolase family 3 protein [Streptomyces sp. SID7805]WSK10991.1 glycoside hydrolase family 3 protein [Streptomyces celluloflavus]